MASFAKIAAVLLVLAMFSAPLIEARELKEAQYDYIPNCRNYRYNGGRRVCGGCNTGFELLGGNCGRGRGYNNPVRSVVQGVVGGLLGNNYGNTYGNDHRDNNRGYDHRNNYNNRGH